MILKHSIQIDDNGTMINVCGVNHKNLRRIESICDVSISSHGNEITIEGKDGGIVQRLLDNLIRISETDEYIYPNMIDLIYNELTDNQEIDFHEVMKSSINIHKANKTITPRTAAQGEYIRLLEQKEIIFSFGPAGTGKTFLSICYAVHQLLEKTIGKIILTRPIVEAGENLGFLPGDYTQKINPYLIPLFDALNRVLTPEIYMKLNAKNMIEVAPLAYMRGRTFENCIVILDEAQNTTCGQMKMFLTRLGDNAKLMINGDITQIDLPKKIKSGMIEALEFLQGIPEIGIMEFKEKDVVRHPVVKKIIHAYKKYEKQ